MKRFGGPHVSCKAISSSGDKKSGFGSVESIGEFLPQLRYGSNLGFQAVIPYSMQFGSYFAGAGFKINGLPPWKSNDFVIGIHGGYKF